MARSLKLRDGAARAGLPWEEEGRLNGEVMKDELTSGLLLNHDFRRTQLRDARLSHQSFFQRSVPTQSVRSPADFGRSGGVSPRGASSAGDVPTVAMMAAAVRNGDSWTARCRTDAWLGH
ncbi:MAG TPA: hypothetical protein VGJ95_19510 [Pseudonocardiaceae bacterium]